MRLIFDKISFIFKILLYYPLCTQSTITYVTRNTSYGQVLGKLVQTEKFNAEVFLGVPYAEAPLNDLRFEYPVEPKKWTKQKMCTEHRPWCIQFLFSPNEESEDCLYLNIVVPYKTKSKSLLYPVMVWIHGGSYHGDGANMFPIEGTINNIVSESIVAVFVNYRVGPFGYLSLINNTLPGNYGMEDQLLALKWVKENIHHFDGNADQVTLAGESAGAASASLLAMSPKANGFFGHLMLRSGSGLAPWALNSERTKLNSQFLLSKLGCTIIDELFECLRNKSVDDFKKSWNAITRDANLIFDIDLKRTRRLPLNHVILTILTPIVDAYRLNESILPDIPLNLVHQSSTRNLLAGTTTAECLTQLHSICALWTFIGSFRHVIARQSQYEDELEFEVSPKQSREFPYMDENSTEVDWETLVPNSLFKNPEYIYQAIEIKYFTNMEQLNKTDKLKLFTKLTTFFVFLVMSDLMVVTPLMLEAEFYAKAGMPVYLYQFDHKHPLMSSKLPECSGTKDYREDSQHGLDVALLFQSASVMGYDLQISNWTSNDLAITELLTEQVSSFVKTGNPNSLKEGNLLWLRYSNISPVALYIEAEIQRIVDIDRSVFNFWYETVPIIDRLKMCSW